jgi:transcriptional regulator with XRE-family HTH domain
MAYLASVVEENMRVYNQLSNNYIDCLEQVKTWRKMTYQQIADAIPMEERQVRRIFNGESNGSIPSLVAICLALYLPPEISFHILEKSPLSWSLMKPDHQWYQFVLRHFSGKSIEETRAFLQAQNIVL